MKEQKFLFHIQVASPSNRWKNHLSVVTTLEQATSYYKEVSLKKYSKRLYCPSFCHPVLAKKIFKKKSKCSERIVLKVSNKNLLSMNDIVDEAKNKIAHDKDHHDLNEFFIWLINNPPDSYQNKIIA